MSLLLAIAVIALLAATAWASDAALPKLRAVPFTGVEIRDQFWAPRQETNRTVSIPHSARMLEDTGTLRNFELAASGAREGYSGPYWMDSDAYKTIEAAAYALASHPDPALDGWMDEVIGKIARAQMADGYLNTWFQVNAPDKRWTNLRDCHELYCAGHLIEAAVAHFQVTGKRSLLDVATRFADHIDSVFGPGKRMGYPGHPELELALVKLWQVTGEQRYFDLARFFVENRGIGFFADEHGTPREHYDGTYWQDNVPIREHRFIGGHAVRAGYLFAGVTDVARETEDEGLLSMLDRVWRNTTLRRMYITGGIGPSAHNEGFTEDYDLPNDTAYQETCASVALALWNHRLNLLYGDARYADLVELSLYNGILAGVSLDGLGFFYVNPLMSGGHHHRSEWFGCACCPPNVTRTIAALGGYAYAVSDDAIWVNLYVQGNASMEVGGQRIGVEVVTEYPWEGKVVLRVVRPDEARFGLRLRVPGWCSQATVSVNGERVASPVVERGYIVLDREWTAGDEVELDLEMPVRMVESHPRVRQNAGRIALQRGPIVYCFEGCDQPARVSEIAIPLTAEFTPEWQPSTLGGVTILRGTGVVASGESWEGRLYRTVARHTPVPVSAVPYYAWDNREPGEMQVWMPIIPPAPPTTLEGRARVDVSFANTNSRPDGINDGREPRSSGEQPAALCHWWPHSGGEEWAQYTWPEPVTVAGASVYWFDDTGRGACRLPVSWEIHYRDGGEWKAVRAASEYPVQIDAWCDVRFAPVTTDALRLVVRMQPEWAAGVHEWRVLGPDDLP